ncbi:MAG: hypothetical protein KAQ62_26995 [Cyclobacteriaceae bacterium]|nr:hypothetical protein [Cyclobacteriaceae bacterium]MCK5208667.1 hypothetical protein [Cyclobacteriaceae bacterium]MCK5372249.1 hypothetical protein [Cyclobacteriaceae bacterium]MCK5470678.1 hypothetical protein [Cyclobacteriaceae bacterium]MCK5703943.1 hypothetical protein [Cyclobacteriaceae bacterium]
MTQNSPLEANRFYHIYNRGINSENLFRADRNYTYFLNKYTQYLTPVVDTFAYCLLKNHFHLLIQVKDQSTLNTFYNNISINHRKKLNEGLHSADFIVSKQFARLFSSYTQAINKANERTGALFETPFKRKEVENNSYLTQMILYIHNNPQKHGFVQDFKDYIHSSYHSHLINKPTKLERQQVILWFGTEKQFIEFHNSPYKETIIKDLIIEI